MNKLLNFKKNTLIALAGVLSCTVLILNCSKTCFCKDINSNYEVVYSKDLNIDEKNLEFKISVNATDCTDGTIQIDGQTLAINADLSKTVGYAHGIIQTQDFTGDGKKEIALILSGGASGSMQAVQVFLNENGIWKEISIPSDIYSNVPSFLKEHQNTLGIATDNVQNYYRIISIDNQKLLAKYLIFQDDDTKADAEICKELIYSEAKKEFVLGNTNIISISKNCSITATAANKAITVKWNSANKKSIRGAQIKVATKKNMKDAKIYKLSKKKAQFMSYKFAAKNGKIKMKQKYYFKVRLKHGKKWTNWSEIQSAKIK